MATSVETLGVDLRTRTKQLGAKEKSRRSTGLVFARVWRGQAAGIALSERLKLRRQMAAAAGKKELVLLSFFMEANSVEVEEGLSARATQAWAEGIWMGRWAREQKETWRKQIFEVQTWK